MYHRLLSVNAVSERGCHVVESVKRLGGLETEGVLTGVGDVKETVEKKSQ